MASELRSCVKVEVAVLLVEVLLYVHRNRRFIRDGTQDVHFDFHTVPELCSAGRMLVEMLLYVHGNRRFIRDGSPGRLPRLSRSS